MFSSAALLIALKCRILSVTTNPTNFSMIEPKLPSMYDVTIEATADRECKRRLFRKQCSHRRCFASDAFGQLLGVMRYEDRYKEIHKSSKLHLSRCLDNFHASREIRTKTGAFAFHSRLFMYWPCSWESMQKKFSESRLC